MKIEAGKTYIDRSGFERKIRKASSEKVCFLGHPNPAGSDLPANWTEDGHYRPDGLMLSAFDLVREKPEPQGLYLGRYCVDGSTSEDPDQAIFDSGAEYPPFRVFDVQKQEHIGPEFTTRSEAENWMRAEMSKSVESKAIPHADLIRAVLDGKVVQLQRPISHDWIDLECTVHTLQQLMFNVATAYRIKPEPVVRWIPLFDTISGISVIVGNTEVSHSRSGQQATTKEEAINALHPSDAKLMRDGHHGKVLRLELDPDTLDVISAKTEAP